MSTPDSHNAFGANSWLIDEMREAWEKDPSSVDESWQAFFKDKTTPTNTVPAPLAQSDHPSSPPHERASRQE